MADLLVSAREKAPGPRALFLSARARPERLTGEARARAILDSVSIGAPGRDAPGDRGPVVDGALARRGARGKTSVRHRRGSDPEAGARGSLRRSGGRQLRPYVRSIESREGDQDLRRGRRRRSTRARAHRRGFRTEERKTPVPAVAKSADMRGGAVSRERTGTPIGLSRDTRGLFGEQQYYRLTEDIPLLSAVARASITPL